MFVTFLKVGRSDWAETFENPIKEMAVAGIDKIAEHFGGDGYKVKEYKKKGVVKGYRLTPDKHDIFGRGKGKHTTWWEVREIADKEE